MTEITLPADLVDWAIQYQRDIGGEPSIEELPPDKDEERLAQAWLREIRNPPEQVSEFLGEVLPKQGGPKLPVVLWSRLSFDLQPYLSTRLVHGSTLFTFYHRELGDAANLIFLSAHLFYPATRLCQSQKTVTHHERQNSL